MTATPAARYLFRSRELQLHEALETNKAVRAVNQSDLLEQRAITRYLVTQLALQAESIDSPVPEQTASSPTDQIRTATTQAIRHLAQEPAGKPLLPERLIALEHLTQTANALDHHTHHGTPDSQAHLQAQLTKSLAETNRLYQEAGIPTTSPNPRTRAHQTTRPGRPTTGLHQPPTHRPEPDPPNPPNHHPTPPRKHSPHQITHVLAIKQPGRPLYPVRPAPGRSAYGATQRATPVPPRRARRPALADPPPHVPAVRHAQRTTRPAQRSPHQAAQSRRASARHQQPGRHP